MDTINNTLKKYVFLPLLILFFTISTGAFASDFSLPFINGSDLGNLYSGWAAIADDASTTYSNPAGLPKITTPQVVVAPLGVFGQTEFQGTTTPPFTASQTGNAKGSIGGFIPNFYVSAPISKRVTFGFGENVPFGLGTNYSKTSIVRYAATRSTVIVVDLTPSIGIKITDLLSVGLGVDAQRLSVTLNNMYGPPLAIPDAEGQNHITGWGYGWHGGVLYQFVPCARVGVSFNSQVMFHPTGDSEVFNAAGEIRTTNQKASIALPARTQASIYYDATKQWAFMATVFYTHWSTLNQVTLKNTMTPIGIVPVTIPFQYHNTVDYALGTNFKLNDKWTLRAGMQYLNSPSNVRDRSVVDPASNMTLVGAGVHYQHNASFGWDIGYAHDFFNQTPINLVTPITTANGHSTTDTNIIGAQLTWNI